MKSSENSESSQMPSPQPKQDPLPVSETLNPSEIESLRQDAKDLNAYCQKAFKAR